MDEEVPNRKTAGRRIGNFHRRRSRPTGHRLRRHPQAPSQRAQRVAAGTRDFSRGRQRRIFFRPLSAAGRAANQTEGFPMRSGTDNAALTRHIARILRQALAHGASVEIDGLGTCSSGGKHGFRFAPQNQPRVFIAYVQEDIAFAKKLYRSFEQSGFRPWLDKKRLLPGQNWPRAIETAIQSSDFFVACFSQRAISKRGSFHSELRYALFCASKVPLDEIFLIPLRLDDCLVPKSISKQTQYLDLFPDWKGGVKRLIAVIKRQNDLRRRKRLPLAG